MTDRTGALTEPFHLPVADRTLYCLAGRPVNREASGLGVLVCPPFAEEMNRVRPTQRLLCETLAADGAHVLACDLLGTGDSSGDFTDGRWPLWLDDLAAGTDWLRAAGCGRVVLLGIRAGALLASALVERRTSSCAGLVLWQPALQGKAVVTELLRARVAAAATTGERESVSALRAALEAGSIVEAAGYGLHPELDAALDAALLPAAPPGLDGPALWIEVGSSARPAATALIDRWRGHGQAVELAQVADPPFWSTTETTRGDATVATTARWLRQIT